MYRLTSFGLNESPTFRSQLYWGFVEPFTRVWGVWTSIVLFGVGTEHAYHKHLIGIFFIIAAFGILFLEIVWAITLFLRLSFYNKDIDEAYCGVRCWYKVLWLSCWRKTILYLPLAALPILFPYKLWLSYVVGLQLCLLAFLHYILSYNRAHTRKNTLLEQSIYYDDLPTNDKFEEQFEQTLLEVIQNEPRTSQETDKQVVARIIDI